MCLPVKVDTKNPILNHKYNRGKPKLHIRVLSLTSSSIYVGALNILKVH